MIPLGSTVEDEVSNYIGVVTSRVEYINGCVQYGVQGYVIEGKLPDIVYFDEGRLEIDKYVDVIKMIDHNAVEPGGENKDDDESHDAPGGPQRDVPSR